MKAKLIIPLGNKRLELEGDGTSKTIMKALSFWSNLPSACGNCQSKDIALNYKSPKNNDYYGLKCCTCSAELNFGQFKTTDGFFLRSDQGWEKWAGKNAEQGNHHKEDAPPSHRDDDIPF